jgi:hypothetical protein
MSRLTVIALLGCLTFAAHAEPTTEADVTLTADAPAAQQLTNVENALRSEGYSEMSAENRTRVQAAVSRIRLKLGSNERVDQLPPLQRTDVFNDQELINTLMSSAKEDSRIVCRSERPTGSNRSQRVCATVAQRRVAMENAKDMMRDMRPAESDKK